MGGKKTIDGIKLGQIVNLLSKLSGVVVRNGAKHPYVAEIDGKDPCPIATTTDAKKMVVPWVAKVTGYDRKKIYKSLKKGTWDYCKAMGG